MYVGKEDPLIHPWFWWHVINNAVQQYCDIFNWSLAPNLHSKTYHNVACDAEQIYHYDVLTLLGIVVVGNGLILPVALNYPGPCITTAIWRSRMNFSQWQHNFQRKLRSHWLKILRQCHVAVVIQGPGPICAEWADVLPQNLMKSRSHEIQI